MPSHLRIQSSFEPISANATYQTSPTLPAAKKTKMSLTQTYYVASTARSKLGREASRADHNLRLLVGHANLLDTLMVELADAEREQEAWFNQSVKKASKPEEPRHIQWIDSIAEAEEEESDDDSDLESDDGSEVYDEEMFDLPLRKLRSPPVEISSAEVSDDDEEFDEDYEEGLALTRTISNKHSPPELTLDSDSESEDESMPSSPENSTFELSEKQREAITTTNFYDMKDVIIQRQQQQPIIAAC